jgi:hypothetical protein
MYKVYIGTTLVTCYILDMHLVGKSFNSIQSIFTKEKHRYLLLLLLLLLFLCHKFIYLPIFAKFLE